MSDPKWLVRARTFLGTDEFPGKPNNPVIVRFWELIKSKVRDDETPWCAAFVGGVLELEGIQSTRLGYAKSYLQWGSRLAKPQVGAIVVFWRGSPNSFSGHVGFVVDWTDSLVHVLGGNQGDSVSLRYFPRARVLGYRWPEGV